MNDITEPQQDMASNVKNVLKQEIMSGGGNFANSELSEKAH